MAGNSVDASNELEESEKAENSLGVNEKTERILKLPITRIKHMIKLDQDVSLASQDAVIMISKATELFVNELSKECYTFTMQSKRKTVQRRDLDLALESVDSLAFLEGTLES